MLHCTGPLQRTHLETVLGKELVAQILLDCTVGGVREWAVVVPREHTRVSKLTATGRLREAAAEGKELRRQVQGGTTIDQYQ